MNLEQLVEQLKQALPTGLRSVVLYGSAAAGDFVPGTSNYNVLVVADRLDMTELNALSKPATQWTRAGHRPPLLFTPAQLEASVDVFPIELLDVQQSHRVLFGEDPLVNIVVNHEHLRLQLERELKGKLLALRERYLLTGGRPRHVVRLLTASLPGFLVLFRAAVRLFRDEIPAGKLAALDALTEYIPFDPGPFTEVYDLKHRRPKVRETAPQALFESYLKTIERVVEAIDRHLHPQA